MRSRTVIAAFVVVGSMTLGGCSSGMDHSNSQLEVGVRAARMNLWREALFRFQRAVQIAPADAMAQNNLAVAYEGTGDFEKARAAYTEALRLDKSNQYIQKNYSRFVEFYSKNRKREMGRGSATPPAAGTADTPAASTAPRPAPPVVPTPPTPKPTSSSTPANPNQGASR